MSVILFLVNITDILKASQEPLWAEMVVTTSTQNKQNKFNIEKCFWFPSQGEYMKRRITQETKIP